MNRANILGAALMAGAMTGCNLVEDNGLAAVEASINETFAGQGKSVKQIDLALEGENRMAGSALVETAGSPGSESRYDCSAERRSDDRSRFSWQCRPAGAVQAAATGGKDSAPAAVGSGSPQAASLVGRWGSDQGCGTILELAEDGSFTLPNGATGEWTLAGDRVTLADAQEAVGFRVAQSQPQHLAISWDDGTSQELVRC